jgi:hypothetical protein
LRQLVVIAQNILAAAQEERFVIEDFTPLADSIEWDLGQQYLRLRGSKAFISDTSPVPFVSIGRCRPIV